MSQGMIPITKPTIGNEEIVAATQALKSGWVSQGPAVAKFEQAFAEYVGSKHACAVANCAAALHLSLLALGIRPGDEVVTVSHSFIATANSIRCVARRPCSSVAFGRAHRIHMIHMPGVGFSPTSGSNVPARLHKRQSARNSPRRPHQRWRLHRPSRPEVWVGRTRRIVRP